MNVPSNIPNGIGVGGGAPQDILSVSLYLSQFAASLNNWAAQVANAVNWLLDKVGGYVTSGEVDIVPSNSTTYNHTSLLLPPGDWDLSGAISFYSAGGTMIEAFCCISPVSLNTGQNDMEGSPWQHIASPATQHLSCTPPTCRQVVTNPAGTLFYLIGYGTASGTISNANGRLSARRWK
jgi:hypothetical protein